MSEYETLLKDPVEGLRLLVTEVIMFGMEDIEFSTILQQELEMRSARTEIVTSFTAPIWRKARELLEQGRAQGVFQFDSLDHAWMFVMGAALAHKKNYQLRLHAVGKRTRSGTDGQSDGQIHFRGVSPQRDIRLSQTGLLPHKIQHPTIRISEG